MNNLPLPPEQVCVLLIVQGNHAMGKQVNSYSISRLLSRLFGIIDLAAVEALVATNYLTKVSQQISDYYLTQRGSDLLMKHKSKFLEYLQVEGYITNTFGHDMAVHFIESI